jgi:hypothetical protein
MFDMQRAVKIIDSLKKQCDIVIVSFHGGGEGPAYEHVTRKDESFMGTRRGNVYQFAHKAIDAGADIVLGNGPHVSRALEIYNNRLIAYSLGNFCTYKSVSVSGVSGLSPLLKVILNKKGEFLHGRVIALRQDHVKGLLPDNTNGVIACIKLLTDSDFPQTGPIIADNGFFKTRTP